MSDPFIGEIRLFAFPRNPDGWLPCNGQLLSIANFDVLYMLLGTTFGGDGIATFGLPDLRGRVPIAAGTGNGLSSRQVGQSFGEVAHTLVGTEMPAHSHALLSTTSAGTTATPAQNVHFAASNTSGALYAPQANVSGYVSLGPSLSQTGSGTPHNNVMPSIVANFCIATEGLVPTPN